LGKIWALHNTGRKFGSSDNYFFLALGRAVALGYNFSWFFSKSFLNALLTSFCEHGYFNAKKLAISSLRERQLKLMIKGAEGFDH
jgi:hypothetical protein